MDVTSASFKVLTGVTTVGFGIRSIASAIIRLTSSARNPGSRMTCFFTSLATSPKTTASVIPTLTLGNFASTMDVTSASFKVLTGVTTVGFGKRSIASAIIRLTSSARNPGSRMTCFFTSLATSPLMISIESAGLIVA